ncbi:MAG: putative amidohydrolase [Candidatus Latescibacterota bacterium]|jgi:predicted amidohydrolase
MIRIGTANCGGSIRQAVNTNYRINTPSEVLAHVGESLNLLEDLIHKAGKAGCDVITFPEDMLGLSAWEAANPNLLNDVLPEVEHRTLSQLGNTAAQYNMYLICSTDTWSVRNTIQNTSFFLDRNGKEIGRYHKIMLPVQETRKEPGTDFPVFETDDLGGVGMLICYDMVFPETARCLALGGADIIFNPTVGGAAFGGADISRAAFRTRAAENFVYIVVSWGGWGTDVGSFIISPHGDIIAEEKEPGNIAIADIDPFAGRECADWSNSQQDMRARLFRERRPETYSRLTEPNPPALSKLPPMTPGPAEEIARITERAMTEGHEQYDEAQTYFKNNQKEKAIAAFEALQVNYPGSLFDRTATERLAKIKKSE